MLLYWIVTICADILLVMPPGVFRVSSFLPPVLGLIWGPAAVLGVGLGEALLHGEEIYQIALALSSGNLEEVIGLFSLPWRDIFCSSLAAWLAYRLWHSKYAPSRHSFKLRPELLLKFTVVIFLITAVKTACLSLTTQKADALRILLGAKSSSTEFSDYLFSYAVTDFNFSLFFGLPLVIFLISRGLAFYMPHLKQQRKLPSVDPQHTPLMLVFHPFLLALFLLLDLSGVLYGLDQLDVWQMFSLEILSSMNLSMIVFASILLKFRYSIMNNIVMLEISTVFIVAFALGSICYVSMNRLAEERIAETLDTVSTLSRQRLSNALDGIRTAAKGMRDLAAQRLASFDRFASSPAYQEEYLGEMEQLLYPIAYHTNGCISFYLRVVKELAGPTSGFYWVRPPGHWEGTHAPFSRRYSTDITHYAEEDLGWYYLPLRRHNPTWIGPYVDVNTNVQVMSYSMPLYVEGKALGIIGMDVDFEYLIHEIRRMSVYEHGFAYLVDRSRHVLYHKDYPPGAQIPPNNSLYTRETYLNSGIWLGISVPIDDIYMDRNILLIHLVMTMMFLSMIISFFIIYLALQGIRPLLSMVIAVKKIAGGRLDTAISYESRNEFGTLAHAIREMAAKLDDYVHRDGLTGLRNTAAYRQAVEKIKEKSQNEKFPYGMVLFDVNFLKTTNDRYGHEAGNELIRQAASLISSVFTQSTVYRVGGDEFIILLEGSDYEKRDELLARFDEKSVHASFRAEEEDIPISVARGLAIHRAGQEFNELFQEADAAMYRNKAAIKAQKKS